MALAEDRTLARPLKILVPLIREELDSAEQAGLEHYRRAGEMLLEARLQIAPGTWGAWLKTNFTLSDSTAHRYIKLATLDAVDPRQRPTLSDAVDRRGTYHQAAWHRPVQEALRSTRDDHWLHDERRAREQEQALMRRVCEKIIQIGYKVLATQMHPDKGGSAQAMARLNRARDHLRGAL